MVACKSFLASFTSGELPQQLYGRAPPPLERTDGHRARQSLELAVSPSHQAGKGIARREHPGEPAAELFHEGPARRFERATCRFWHRTGKSISAQLTGGACDKCSHSAVRRIDKKKSVYPTVSHGVGANVRRRVENERGMMLDSCSAYCVNGIANGGTGVKYLPVVQALRVSHRCVLHGFSPGKAGFTEQTRV